MTTGHDITPPRADFADPDTHLVPMLIQLFFIVTIDETEKARAFVHGMFFQSGPIFVLKQDGST